MSHSLLRDLEALSLAGSRFTTLVQEFVTAAPGQRPQTAPGFARRLRLEHLEARQLLASDLGSQLPKYSAATDYLDTNCDARISADEISEASLPSSDRNNIRSDADASPLSQMDGGGLTAAARGPQAPKPAYQYWITGNSRNVTVPNPMPGLALVGGGTDVDEVFRWMGDRAPGGDFLVLTASSNGIYNNYISRLAPALDSVATLQIPSADAAKELFVAARIREADAIFITGGDQSKYVNFWDETPVEDELYAALARGVTIGGTSAGLAVLGDYDFSAVVDTITSPEALSDPYDSAVTLDDRFLSNRESLTSTVPNPLAYLTDTVTDSHFQQRDRLGRLVTFMARLDSDGSIMDGVTRGIGINEQTALLVDSLGMAKVIGNPYVRNVAESLQQRSVYFLSRPADTFPDALSSPLDYEQVHVARRTYDPKLKTGDTFDLASWVVPSESDVDNYFISAMNGVLSPNPYGA